MFSDNEHISAFAVYSAKRKNSVTPLQLQKFQKKHSRMGRKQLKKVKKVSAEGISPRSSSVNKRQKSPKNVSPPKTCANFPRVVDVDTKLSTTHDFKNRKETEKRNSLFANTFFLNNFENSSTANNTIKNNITLMNFLDEDNNTSKNNKSKRLNNNNKANTTENEIPSKLNNIFKKDPILRSYMLLEWMIYPLTIKKFLNNYWEKKPAFIKRSNADYYKVLISTPIFDKILRDNCILFSKNIDITSYDDIRENHNPDGRALPTVVWDYYRNGCSVRMLNPQTYLPRIHLLNATLQEFFGCFVGSNSYLTPPDSQGFAPHYDDIEAFILQIEGKKRWRLYNLEDKKHYLPRYSSTDLKESDLGEPFFDEILEAGDMLYFPRGTVHQGMTNADSHSLHLTLSVYQKNAWCDLLEKVIPNALEKAIVNNPAFREGLPIDYWRHFGFVHPEGAPTKDFRASFETNIKSLIDNVKNYLDIDKAVDEIVRSHIHDFLPPQLLKFEQKCTSIQDGERMVAEGVVKHHVTFKRHTKIRLIRAHCVRLIKEEDGVFNIYYSCDNSKEYHQNELQSVEIDELFVPGVKELILQYPKFIKLEDLPIQGEDNQYQMAKDLWERGILMTETPMVSSHVQNDD